MSVSSDVSPELDKASTASCFVTMPRSPWLASAGWTYIAGVPVEARVAAILRPTWPLLPMPVTMTRPPSARVRMSRARGNSAPKRAAMVVSASASAVSTRRATSRSAAVLSDCKAASCVIGRRPSPKVFSGSFRFAVNLRQNLVRENVFLFPTRQIEGGAVGKEVETGLGQLDPAFARQQFVHLVAQAVQIEHVRGGIVELLLCQGGSAPIGGLLLLGQLDAEQFQAQILEAVALGIGAHQLGGGAGAIGRAADDVEMALDHRQIEAGEMEDLGDRSIGQNAAQIGSAVVAIGEMDHMDRAVAGRELHHAQAVTLEPKPHRFAIDGDGGAEIETGRQIALVITDRHIGPE